MTGLRASEKIELLRGSPLFADLSKRELGILARYLTEVPVAVGESLATQGERAREAVLIVDGTALVTRNGKKLNQLGPGDILGEIGLVVDVRRTADVVATSDMTVLLMDPREFSAVLEAQPRVAVKVLKTVAERLVDLNPDLI